jgi:hypothetical protein
MIAYIYNPSTWGAKPRGSRVQRQPGLHRMTLSQIKPNIYLAKYIRGLRGKDIPCSCLKFQNCFFGEYQQLWNRLNHGLACNAKVCLPAY